MKEILRKYYGLELEYSREYNDGIIFFVNGDYYYLCKCVLSNDEVDKSYELYLLLKQNNILMHDFIFNNDNKLLSDGYVLLKLNYLIDDVNINDLKKLQISLDYDLKDNFYILWINKIDYLEKQLLDMSENKVINYSFDYFVGIAEMLLSFYKDNINQDKNSFVVHRTFYTLSSIDFYNPLNIVLGEKIKDVAAYIRLTNNWNLIYELLNVIDYSDKICLFVRLVFPFYYFYLVNSCLVDGCNNNKLLNLVQDINKYEEYLSKLENIFGINLFYWIKKDN